MTAGALAWLLARNGFWAAVATLGFAVSFSVPKYALLPCALIGALAYALRTALMSAGAGIVMATLLAGILLGMLAAASARSFAVSSVLFAAGPAIPLVPGTYAYKAVVGILLVAGAPGRQRSAELLLAAFDDGVKAALTIVALSCGIALPGLVWMSFRRSPAGRVQDVRGSC